MVICADSREIRSLGGDDRDRAGVDAVGLAAMARLEDPHSRREGRGHVCDVLAGGDELLGQQIAQAAGALERRSGHCWAHPNNWSHIERAARTRIVPTSARSAQIVVAVCEALCGSMPMTTVISSLLVVAGEWVPRRAT